MDQYGCLIIKIAVVKLHFDGRITMAPAQVSKVNVRREEARRMMEEHKKQVREQDANQYYTYDWQPEAENWSDPRLY